MKKSSYAYALCFAAVMCAPVFSLAQVAGTSTVDTTISEATQLAMGWSAKKSILGKSVYNEAGVKVGKVEDLIVSPGRNVSFLIIGAGGFVGIGRHDVAVAADHIQNQSGRLVMAGATKDSIKAMPVFQYATDMGRRDEFIAATDKEIGMAKVRLADLRSAASSASAEAKASLLAQATTVEGDINLAEAKLGEMKRASVKQWGDFEVGVSTVMAHLRQSVSNAKS